MPKIVKISRDQLRIIKESVSNIPLSGNEIIILEVLSAYFTPNSTPSEIISFLRDSGGYDARDISRFYFLFLKNYREDGNYTNITNPNRGGGHPIIDKIVRIIGGEEPRDVITKIDLGDDIKLSDDGSPYRYRNEKFDYIHFTVDKMIINTPMDKFIEKYSTVYDDDHWRLSLVINDTPENDELDSDELNYMGYFLDEDNILLLIDLAELLGDTIFIEKIKRDKSDTGLIHKFLNENIPESYLDDLESEYLSNLGDAVHEGEMERVKEYFNNEYPFGYTADYNSVTFEIPYNSFFEYIISTSAFISFSDLPDLPIFDKSISLEDEYHNGQPDETLVKYMNTNFKYNLEKIIEEYESGELIKYKNSTKKFNAILKDLKFQIVKQYNVWVETNRGDIKITIKHSDVDYGNEKVKIQRYDNSSGFVTEHLIPFNELTNYVNQIDIIREARLLRRSLR